MNDWSKFGAVYRAESSTRAAGGLTSPAGRPGAPSRVTRYRPPDPLAGEASWRQAHHFDVDALDPLHRWAANWTARQALAAALFDSCEPLIFIDGFPHYASSWWAERVERTGGP